MHIDHRYYRHVPGIGNEITCANATIQKLRAFLVALCGGGCALAISKMSEETTSYASCVCRTSTFSDGQIVVLYYRVLIFIVLAIAAKR